jgi:hypothetical protein
MHVSQGVHHNPKKAKAASDEEWLAVLKEVREVELGEVR